jgi:DNA mismatch repair protein MutS2
MNRHALEVLELGAAVGLVARHAASVVGAAALHDLRPSVDGDWIRRELRLVTEGIALLARDGGWPMPAVADLREALDRLRLEGYAWDGPTLRSGAELIAASRTVRRLILPLRDEIPSLAAIAEQLADLSTHGEEIGRAIGEDGAVLDSASPELRSLRREIHGARSRIVGRLTEYAASLASQFQVPDGSVSIRDGRYVIPVRREGRSEVGGIVHGESQTGATLFIEPQLAIEMMNRLRELEARESREVQRILSVLTASLRPHADELSASLEALVRLDTIHARARYAVAVGGHPPEIADSGRRGIGIVQGRHPILLDQGEAVVPFDLDMDADERTLVISGPNTGGKTVFLKALGLLALLTQSGIVPPVGRGTRLPVFAEVFADIGDEQSIEASLSTFSAHLKNLRETLVGANERSLVLIDEIGSGTDPVEGGALARAILEELTERGCFTVATTHLGTLKLLASGDARVVNASLQFDAERLQPTYRLLKGVPGQSYGLAIARRLGLPIELIERAEASLPAGERDVARLLLDLEAKEQRLARLGADLDLEVNRTRALREELETRQRDLIRREKDAERRARQQARDLLMKSRVEVEEAIRQVRESADEASLDEAARAARRRVEEAARRQREKTPTAPMKRGLDEPAPAPLRTGARVRIESLGRTGTLLEVRDARALVEAGGLRMQLPVDDLSMLPEGDQAPAAGTEPRRKPAGGRYQADMDASPEVDLRGLRVDELGLRLGRALDAAHMAGLPTFRIIHGKGTGALRAQVEDLLRGDPRITSYRPGERFEGGTGVTVVEFG